MIISFDPPPPFPCLAGVVPSRVTIISALRGLTRLRDKDAGKEEHACVVNHSPESLFLSHSFSFYVFSSI